MITPDYLNEIMYATEDSLVRVDNYLIRRIAKRVRDTFTNGEGNLFIPATINDLRKLMQNGVLYEDIVEAVAKAMPEIEKEVRQAFYQSAGEITRQNMDFANSLIQLKGFSSVNVPEYEQVGIVHTAEQLQMTPAEIRQLEAAYKRTRGTIKNLTRTTASQAQNIYIEACDTAYWKAKSGVSVHTAIIEAVEECLQNGVSVVSFGGKKENIDVAIARAVRTGVNQANGDITLTRLAEMGVNYVKTSWHIGARVTDKNDYTNHSWWQGRVFHIDWSNPVLNQFMKDAGTIQKGFEWLSDIHDSMRNATDPYKNIYPDFMEECRYGDVQGICGANCRHTFQSYYPGINVDDDDRPDLDENEKRYKLEQKQRALERDLRKAKRKLEAIKEIKNDSQEWKDAHRKAKALVKNKSEIYMDFCQRNRLKPRNMSIK